MVRPDRTVLESDAASLERLRQITARIRARAAEGVTRPGPRRAVPAQPPTPAAPQHWSDGPAAEDDEPDES
jgi:hypothetical protein